MQRKPGIDRRIKRLSVLLIHGGHAERLIEFVEELVNGRRRPIKPEKATKELARELLPYVSKAKIALEEAEKYLLACFKPAKAIRLSKKPRASRGNAKEEKAGDRGC